MEVVESVTMADVLLVARQDLIVRERFELRAAVVAIAVATTQPLPLSASVQ